MTYFSCKRMVALAIIMVSALVAFGQSGMPAHYPQKPVSTGNSQLDDENWVKAKNEWIANYPDEYRSMGGNPDAVIVKETPVEKPVALGVDFSAPNLFKFVSATAVDINSKHTPVEMKGFNEEAAGMPFKNAIVIDWENSMWYRKNNVSNTESGKHFTIIDGRIVLDDCKACYDHIFTIVKQTPDELIVYLKPQDEGQYFVFELTFKK
jgi:hypothetical protein